MIRVLRSQEYILQTLQTVTGSHDHGTPPNSGHVNGGPPPSTAGRVDAWKWTATSVCPEIHRFAAGPIPIPRPVVQNTPFCASRSQQQCQCSLTRALNQSHTGDGGGRLTHSQHTGDRGVRFTHSQRTGDGGVRLTHSQSQHTGGQGSGQ